MKYTLRVPVLEAIGYQFWEVDADSPEDAIKSFENGEGMFSIEEIEVKRIGKPKVVGEVE